ncbi:MAG: TRAP transporter small permease subunit [Gracilibacteraceae bacterium]|jgi:TRAP-type mannitol/chloroaromatic compound transport system permease small subunit|nr:TRAP transporter small permease subunit [Gracilibacteraceae bacterium]
MQLLRKITTTIDKISEYTGKAVSYLILVVCVLEVAEVLLRYVFKSPTSWIWELCTIITGGIFVVGGAWVLKEGKHVRTDIIFGRLSRRGQAIVDVALFFVVFTTFAYILISKTVANAIYSWQIDERTFTMWGPPLGYMKTGIAVGFILLTLQALAKLIRDIHYVVKGEEL